MASEPPPKRPDEELRVVDDPDFGRMRLVRTWGAGKRPEDREWREFAMHSWEAKVGGVQISLDVDEPTDAPDLTSAARSAILKVLTDEAATRRAVAEGIIETAREWMEMSGDGPEPTVESFAAGITLQVISIDRAQHVNVWLEEIDIERSIFHGHGLRARLSGQGAVEDVDLS